MAELTVHVRGKAECFSNGTVAIVKLPNTTVIVDAEAHVVKNQCDNAIQARERPRPFTQCPDRKFSVVCPLHDTPLQVPLLTTFVVGHILSKRD